MSPMVLLAAAALSITPPPPPRAAAVVQATATIRIIQAVRLRLDGSANVDAPPAHETTVAEAKGTPQTVRLIEFE